MPCSGKTTLGRGLANRLNRSWIDLDQLIEERIGMTCKEYASKCGDPAFRIIESEILQTLSPNQNSVISVGSGCVDSEGNRLRLRQLGQIIRVSCSNEKLYERLSTKGFSTVIPNRDKLEEVYQRRQPLYTVLSHDEVDTSSSSIEESVEELVQYCKRSVIQIQHKEKHYPIVIGDHIVTKELPKMVKGKHVTLVIDKVLQESHEEPLVNILRAQGYESLCIPIDGGEECKTRAMKENIEDIILSSGHVHDTTLVAIGGGSVSDLIGFVAATVHRGIPLILIPTTLLAMVDASIGGKNGINTVHGKNILGTIYPPIGVIIDVMFLRTLPMLERQCGMAEIVKHALIKDLELFEMLERNIEAYLKLTHIEELIERSCKIKQSVVEADPEGRFLRHILNFGHTIGHAVEKMSEYMIPHGIAVAYGMMVESALSNRATGISETKVKRIDALIKRCCPSVQEMNYSISGLWPSLLSAKNVKQKAPFYVALNDIGEVNARKIPLPDFCHDLNIVKSK
jgi:3-dehydroquinate synthase